MNDAAHATIDSQRWIHFWSYSQCNLFWLQCNHRGAWCVCCVCSSTQRFMWKLCHRLSTGLDCGTTMQSSNIKKNIWRSKYWRLPYLFWWVFQLTLNHHQFHKDQSLGHWSPVASMSQWTLSFFFFSSSLCIHTDIFIFYCFSFAAARFASSNWTRKRWTVNNRVRQRKTLICT